jgi:hypothetical protein
MIIHHTVRHGAYLRSVIFRRDVLPRRSEAGSALPALIVHQPAVVKFDQAPGVIHHHAIMG